MSGILNANGEREKSSTATEDTTNMLLQLVERSSTAGLPNGIFVGTGPTGEVEIAMVPLKGNVSHLLALIGGLEMMKTNILAAINPANRPQGTRQ